MKILRQTLRGRSNGFTLIEAMIAVVVLATGLLALAALQGAIIRSSADAKARSQLAAYAQSELDRLRLGGVNALSNSTKTTTTITNPADPLLLAANAGGVSQVQQTVTQTQYVFNPATGTFAPSATNPTNQAYFKRVTLRLTWNDAANDPRSLVLETTVSPLALNASQVLVDRSPPDDLNLKPIVRRPTPVTEGMIPIAMGNSQDTAATNPKPQLLGREQNTLVSDTRFDVLTYNTQDTLGVAGFARFDKRIETAMVGCSCQTGLGGFPTTGNSPPINVVLRDRAFRPTFWNGENYSVPVSAGTPVASPDNSVAQSALCDVCCRDHRDPSSASGPKFNPWNSGSHDHFDIAGNAVTSGGYREACRLIRVEGVWRVAADPRVEDVALLATRAFPATTGGSTAPADNNTATQPLISSAGTDAYIAYAYLAIKAMFFDRSVFDGLATQAATALNDPSYVPIKAGEKRWLHARGLLRDFLEPDAVRRLQKAATECEGTSVIEKAQCVLPFSPMATLNATELAVWAGKQTSERGTTPPSGVSAANVNFADARLRQYPSALALVSAISPFDGTGSVFDEQLFTLTTGSASQQPWLRLASPAGVLFGNPGDPIRGFATVSGGIRFNAVWTLGSGPSIATDNQKQNDPLLEIGLNSAAPCNPNTSFNTSNPYSCTSASTTGTVLVIGGFNYVVPRQGNLGNPCPGGTGSIGEGQAKCMVHRLSRVAVDGVDDTAALNSNTLIAGTSGAPSAKRRITLSAALRDTTITPNPPTPSQIELIFTADDSRNASAVCNASTFAGWTCE